MSSTRLKRRRSKAESCDHSDESQPSKRHKSGIKLHSAEFYDSLSKVWLTRRALKELDRRTSQANSPQQPVLVPQHIYREDTWQQIKQFVRHGGPELRDLLEYPAPPNITEANVIGAISYSSSVSSSRQIVSTATTSRSTKTRRSSVYNNFEQNLIEYYIYLEGYDYPNDRQTPEPKNLEEIYQRLTQPRPSLSPSCFTISDFQTFKRANNRVISKESKTIVDAKPDFHYGARLELQSYKQEPVYDNKAYTLTSTYHNGQLLFYAHHPTAGPENSAEYHMTQIDGWTITGNPHTFRQGVTAFRNTRDWTREQRDAFILTANERARSIHAQPSQLESPDYNERLEPTEVQDANHPAQAGGSQDGFQCYMSQQVVQGGHNNELSHFTCNFGDSHTMEVQLVEESAKEGAEGNSEKTVAHAIEESETSVDELALDRYKTPTTPHKRRLRGGLRDKFDCVYPADEVHFRAMFTAQGLTLQIGVLRFGVLQLR
ncbi:hypothetical protein B7463_g2715, partial [Scytalidium lignicola]